MQGLSHSGMKPEPTEQEIIFTLAETESELLRFASPLRDIGKIAIPDAGARRARLRDAEVLREKDPSFLCSRCP